MLDQYANPAPRSNVRYHFVEASDRRHQNAISHVRYNDEGEPDKVLAFTHCGVSVEEGLALVREFNGDQPRP